MITCFVLIQWSGDWDYNFVHIFPSFEIYQKVGLGWIFESLNNRFNIIVSILLIDDKVHKFMVLLSFTCEVRDCLHVRGIVWGVEYSQRGRIDRWFLFVPVAKFCTGLFYTYHGTRCDHFFSVIKLVEHQGVVGILIMSKAVLGKVIELSYNWCLLYVDQVLAVHYWCRNCCHGVL